MVIHGKKLVGGYQIGPGTNFRHTFRKYLPEPPACSGKNPRKVWWVGWVVSAPILRFFPSYFGNSFLEEKSGLFAQF